MSLIEHGEFPDSTLGVSFKDLAMNGSSPWDFVELRIDWSRNTLKYYVDGKLYRTVHRHGDKDYPQTPSALHLKHWSIGNFFSSQGPPRERTVGDIGWTRFFFNSSLTTKQGQEIFNQQCTASAACRTSDMSLRESSLYPNNAIEKWHQKVPVSARKLVPEGIAIFSISLSGFLLFFAFLKMIPWNKLSVAYHHGTGHPLRFPWFSTRLAQEPSANPSDTRYQDADTEPNPSRLSFGWTEILNTISTPANPSPIKTPTYTSVTEIPPASQSIMKNLEEKIDFALLSDTALGKYHPPKSSRNV